VAQDLERFFAELTALTDLVNAGAPGLTAVQRLVELAQSSLAAVGASFAEYGPAGGRIIAASGATVWGVGRFVDTAEPLVVQIMGSERVVESRLAELPAGMADRLDGFGVRRILCARVQLAGRVAGTLHLCYPDDGATTPAQRAGVSFFAGVIGHLYADGQGLPLYSDEPATGTLADAIAVVGPDGTVRSWNAAAATVTGRPAATALGRPLPVAVPATGQSTDQRLPDGRWLQVLATGLPGTTDRLVTLRDVTLAHRREQARDLFVAVTSHELRTPVTVIKGYADTLVGHWDELPDQARRDAAYRLGQRADHLARTLERLLSAVGDGSALAGPAAGLPFDLGTALRDAVHDLPVELGATVYMNIPDDLPKALGERATVATVLSELVTNAVKYADPDTAVDLSTLVDARSVGFRVADRGIGLRPEYVERAFERFWQAESGNQRKHGGVGLGLYLVRRVIERQNGWVSLRPREGGGTVAEVRLPRADQGPGEAKAW
jgi:two-component system, OmpR family, phosphate regulon sensor histidine kinase PhoR